MSEKYGRAQPDSVYHLSRVQAKPAAYKPEAYKPEIEPIDREQVTIAEYPAVDCIQIILPLRPSKALRDLLEERGFTYFASANGWRHPLQGGGREAVESLLDEIGDG